MNNIFFKNLTALATKNKPLAEKLQTFVPDELPKLVQNNGSFNLFYKERLIHNEKNPLAEAQEIFNGAKNSPVSIHLVFGLGLGYLFQVASLNSLGAVILFEPDLNILWTAFTLVDFSNDILKKNVFITSDFQEVTEALYKKSGMKNNPVMLSVPSQRKFDENFFDNFVKKIQDVIGSYTLDLKYTQERFYPSLKMLIKNIPNLFSEIPLIKLKDLYKDKTAVIVSAGPTLDRNIEALKKNRDKYVLFTVGTAVKTLYANGLKPDFLCIIEAFNSSRQIEGLDLSDVNFITEPYSHSETRQFKFKNIYSHISANMPINHFWSDLTDENIEEYWSKGTVSYTALNSARILGFNKIILVGQDLAYIGGQCYSKDSAYKDLVCDYNKEKNSWEIRAKDFEKFAYAISPCELPVVRERMANRRLENLNKSLYYVKGINGDMLPTESVYASFIKPLSEFAEHFKDRRYINTSLVGALIEGYENLSLEEALKDSDVIVNEDFSIEFKYNQEEIKKRFYNELALLKTANKFTEEGKKYIKSLNNDLKRLKNVNVDILKTLKKLSENYLYLSSDFANKSKMFDYISTSDKIDLDYEMKMMKEFTYDSVSNILAKLSEFYLNTETRIVEVEGLANESFNTKG